MYHIISKISQFKVIVTFLFFSIQSNLELSIIIKEKLFPPNAKSQLLSWNIRRGKGPINMTKWRK